MAQRLPVLYQKKPCYDIVFSQNYDGLAEELLELGHSGKKCCIVTDSNVEKLYGAQVKEILSTVYSQVILFSFPAGESSKTLDTVQELYADLMEAKFDRKDIIAALGGGVTGDLAGYAAATYLRGIDFIQLPTTLLAQVDSSVGGKTGVDFAQYKNMVGAFHMPALVYINLSVLKDLDDRQYYAGMAEVMKYGLIRDSIFYEWLIEHLYEIHDRDMAVLEEMVLKSCQHKKLIVEKDPLEQGDRALLNLGHTVGHAIEKAKNFELLHGECVALGCVAAAYISWKKELLSMDEYYEIRDMFVPFNLPISIDSIVPEEIADLTLSDKKMEAGKLKFILLKKVGKAVINTSVTKEELLEGIREIHYREEDNYE